MTSAMVQWSTLKWPARLALSALALMLFWNLAEFIALASRTLAYPYELDYGEGIVWHQARQLFAGEAFGDIDRFPAIVFHYTPFFHTISGLLASAGMDGLAAGRLVSLAATLIMALFIGLIAARLAELERASRPVAVFSGAVAGLLVLASFPVLAWAPLMRVDMLAFALTFAGFYISLRALDKGWLILLAALSFVLAVYTKQTMIAAPASVFFVLLIVRPRLAFAGIASCLVMGLAALGVLTWLTDGGFLRHIFLYNVNRFDPERLFWIADVAAGHIFLVILAAIGLVRRAARLRNLWQNRSSQPDPADTAFAMVFVFAFLTTIMLLLVGKSGSSVNYFIEWFGVICICCGLMMHDAIKAASQDTAGGKRRLFGVDSVSAALVVQIFMFPAMPYSSQVMEDRASGLAEIEQQIARAEKPVISDDMVILLRAGQPVLWESAIFAELGSTGLWDERPFVTMIRNRDFAFFVTFGERGMQRFDERYNPSVADALYTAYPRRERLAGLTLHLPEQRQPLPPPPS